MNVVFTMIDLMIKKNLAGHLDACLLSIYM